MQQKYSGTAGESQKGRDYAIVLYTGGQKFPISATKKHRSSDGKNHSRQSAHFPPELDHDTAVAPATVFRLQRTVTLPAGANPGPAEPRQ